MAVQSVLNTPPAAARIAAPSARPAAASGFNIRDRITSGIESTLPSKFNFNLRLGAPRSSDGDDGGDQPTKNVRGSIVGGIALGMIGSALIASASVGIPAVAQLGTHALPAVAPGLLNNALRFCGLVAYVGAASALSQGDNQKLVRGAVLTSYGALGMAAAAGAFGHIGGLTSVCMAVGGFFTTLNGLGKLAG